MSNCLDVCNLFYCKSSQNGFCINFCNRNCHSQQQHVIVHAIGHIADSPQTKLREGNVFTPVCDSVHKMGGSLSEGSSVQGVSVRETPMYGKERAICILLECFLLKNVNGHE